jgi:hypothetical protein
MLKVTVVVPSDAMLAEVISANMVSVISLG